MLITWVAINGHSTLMLFSAAPLFSELETFEASTSQFHRLQRYCAWHVLRLPFPSFDQRTLAWPH